MGARQSPSFVFGRMVRPQIATVLACTLAVLACITPAAAQFTADSFLYNQTIGWANDLLTAQLQDHPDVEDIFYPAKYMLPRDFYVYEPPDRETQYTQNVIFDPCRGHEYNCCNDTYGTPEFELIDQETGQRTYANQDGSELPTDSRRRPNDQLVIDETCMGENSPPGRVDCVTARVARRPYPVMPKCWNYNDTVVADSPCRAPADGAPLPLCLELGYTQTAYVMQCGDKYTEDDHCGTFLEVHRPGRADKLAEVRLRGVYPSGYRMTVITTTYKAQANRTLCYDPINGGAYELWWVVRTLYNFKVERLMPFKVASPECDWDAENNRFLPYATLFNADGTRNARQLMGLDPFDPKTRLFTQPRPEAGPDLPPVKPGKGMGSTLVPAVPGVSYPATAVFDDVQWENHYSYTFTPDKPEYRANSGYLEPSLPQQVALKQLIERRGYRRLLEAGRKREAEALRAGATAAAQALWSAQRAARLRGAAAQDAAGTSRVDAGSDDAAVWAAAAREAAARYEAAAAAAAGGATAGRERVLHGTDGATVGGRGAAADPEPADVFTPAERRALLRGAWEGEDGAAGADTAAAGRTRVAGRR